MWVANKASVLLRHPEGLCSVQVGCHFVMLHKLFTWFMKRVYREHDQNTDVQISGEKNKSSG